MFLLFLVLLPPLLAFLCSLTSSIFLLLPSFPFPLSPLIFRIISSSISSPSHIPLFPLFLLITPTSISSFSFPSAFCVIILSFSFTFLSKRFLFPPLLVLFSYLYHISSSFLPFCYFFDLNMFPLLHPFLLFILPFMLLSSQLPSYL